MDTGDIWFRAFDKFGENVSSGLQEAFKTYHAQKDKIDKADAVMKELSQTVDPATITADKPEGRFMIDPKAYEDYLHHSGTQRVAIESAKLGVMGTLMHMQKSANDAIKTTTQTELAKARMGNVTARTQETQVDIAQKLGLIAKPPHIAPPPTGNAIMTEQRAQRKERYDQRLAIATTIANEKPVPNSPVKSFINDPAVLLDKGAISYKAKTGMFGGFGDVKPDKATHVQIEDGPIFTTKQFNRLQNHAKEWQRLGNVPTPQVNAPPQAMQMLIQNPTPEMKALFDKKYNGGKQGAADLVLSAAQPSATPEPDATPKPDADAESPDEQQKDTEEE